MLFKPADIILCTPQSQSRYCTTSYHVERCKKIRLLVSESALILRPAVQIESINHPPAPGVRGCTEPLRSHNRAAHAGCVPSSSLPTLTLHHLFARVGLP